MDVYSPFPVWYACWIFFPDFSLVSECLHVSGFALQGSDTFSLYFKFLVLPPPYCPPFFFCPHRFCGFSLCCHITADTQNTPSVATTTNFFLPPSSDTYDSFSLLVVFGSSRSFIFRGLFSLTFAPLPSQAGSFFVVYTWGFKPVIMSGATFP